MTWTTVCDLPMTDYDDHRVLDSTEFRNHADLLGNAQPGAGYVAFADPGAQLEVPVRDDSLARMSALRVQVLVKPGPITRRFNLVEGWMSFAVVIQADGRLAAAVYDGQQWIGPTSVVTVASGQWARVMFEYDGVSIATLTLDGNTVGSRLDMPAGIRSPQQVITLGHWPRGDDRYTLEGDLGHVRIEKRDIEEYWRDALQNALCRRRLSGRQAAALKQIEAILTAMEPAERQRRWACAVAQAERLRQFLHDLRTSNPREVVHLRRLGDQLRAAWCGTFDPVAAQAALLEYFRHLSGGDPQSPRLRAALQEFLDLSQMCAGEPDRTDQRLRELGAVLFPELESYDARLREIADSV